MTPDQILETEFSSRFVEGMKARMLVSFFKYGFVADAYPHRVNAISSLKARLNKYEIDGNTEWLMDVANFAMIEFMHPGNELAHFRGTDSDESPGRVRNDGSVNADPNKPVDAVVETIKARMQRDGD